MRGTTNAHQSNLRPGDWVEISNNEISVKASSNVDLVIEEETSDLFVPTQKAVKTYVDNLVGNIENVLIAINGPESPTSNIGSFDKTTQVLTIYNDYVVEQINKVTIPGFDVENYLTALGSDDLAFDFANVTEELIPGVLACPSNNTDSGSPLGVIVDMSGSLSFCSIEGSMLISEEALETLGMTFEQVVQIGGVVDKDILTITGSQGNYDVTFNSPAPTPSYTEEGLLEIDWSPLSQVGDTIETTGEADGNSIKLILTDDTITAKVNNNNATLYYSLYDLQDTKIGDYELNSIELTSENSFTVTNGVCGDIYFAFEEDSETAKLVVGEIDNYQIENVYVRF